MEVIVGTYDEVILGYRLVKIGQDVQIETSFTDNSHSGCVRCMTVSEKGVLASGSSDESIRLLNIRKRKEMGSLVHHNGTITSVQFHHGFLFSTSEDGALCLWKNFTWECMRTFKGHKSGINCVSVHPSGKLALTVGKDRALHTWNLVTGRSAFISNIKQVADLVRWSPDGQKYAIVVNNKIDVYSVETAEVIVTVQSETRINCLEFYTADVVCYSGEGGRVVFHNIASNKTLHTEETGTTRVKGLSINLTREFEGCEKILSIASSDGFIQLYSITGEQEDLKTEKLLEYNTGFRITCMAVFAPTPTKTNVTKTVEIKTEVVSEESDNEKDTEVETSSKQIGKKKVKFEDETESEPVKVKREVTLENGRARGGKRRGKKRTSSGDVQASEGKQRKQNEATNSFNNKGDAKAGALKVNKKQKRSKKKRPAAV